jgi:hypothetical protein
MSKLRDKHEMLKAEINTCPKCAVANNMGRMCRDHIFKSSKMHFKMVGIDETSPSMISQRKTDMNFELFKHLFENLANVHGDTYVPPRILLRNIISARQKDD